MCQLVETIKCFNGKIFNLKYHQIRFNYTRKKIFNLTDELLLSEAIIIPPENEKGLFRCRVVYSSKIELIEFVPHQYRPIKSLRLVESTDINYNFKYTCRENLDQLFARRGLSDDIIIVKDDLITDSYTANLIFFDGKKWWTPDTPLLLGTQRERLLSEGKIFPRKITIGDLTLYQKAGLINAMQSLENMPIVDINQIQKF